MLRCDLDLCPVNLESSWYIKRHVVKLCTKYEWNRTIHSWIIDDFAIFLHTLCRAVTLIFDLLTLNFYSTSRVIRLSSVENFSKIEWFTAEYCYRRYSTFTPCSFRVWGTTVTELSQGCVICYLNFWGRQGSCHGNQI